MEYSGETATQLYVTPNEGNSSANQRDSLDNTAPAGARQNDQQHSQMVYMAKDPAERIPAFKGDPIQFQEWWRLLHYYVDSQPIDETEICRIIKDSIQGWAARFVQYLPVCAESYELVKTTMQRRYGQTSQAESAHIQKIHQLCTWKELEKNDKFVDFLSLLAQRVNALIVLGFPYDSLSTALTPVILASIPQNYRLKFNSRWRTLKVEGKNKLKCLTQFLNEQSILLEEEKFALVNLRSKQTNQKNKKGKYPKDSKEHSSKNFKEEADSTSKLLIRS